MIVICQYTGEVSAFINAEFDFTVDKHDGAYTAAKEILAEWIDEEEAEDGIESDYDWIRGGC